MAFIVHSSQCSFAVRHALRLACRRRRAVGRVKRGLLVHHGGRVGTLQCRLAHICRNDARAALSEATRELPLLKHSHGPEAIGLDLRLAQSASASCEPSVEHVRALDVAGHEDRTLLFRLIAALCLTGSPRAHELEVLRQRGKARLRAQRIGSAVFLLRRNIEQRPKCQLMAGSEKSAFWSLRDLACLLTSQERLADQRSVQDALRGRERQESALALVGSWMHMGLLNRLFLRIVL
mmetsp:Transcript_34767/g.86734  ORF Transcript_34767/g.86734 Transcript_34767/m.86734 type:complete len:236 (+) Transcript_34767:159-866(+)